ncbi:hypothetical protein OC835_005565 [Tilletia horrida]|nr:hypothetical protein OC835_005565 [Tilletia horrida]
MADAHTGHVHVRTSDPRASELTMPAAPTATAEYVDEDDGKPVIFPRQHFDGFRMGYALASHERLNAPLRAELDKFRKCSTGAGIYIRNAFRALADVIFQLQYTRDFKLRGLVQGMATRVARVLCLVTTFHAITRSPDSSGTPLNLLLSILDHRLQLFAHHMGRLRSRYEMPADFQRAAVVAVVEIQRLAGLIKKQVSGEHHMRSLTALSSFPPPSVASEPFLQFNLIANVRDLSSEIQKDQPKFRSTLPDTDMLLLLRIFLLRLQPLQPSSAAAQEGAANASSPNSVGDDAEAPAGGSHSDADIFSPFTSADKALEDAKQNLSAIGFGTLQRLGNWRIAASNRVVSIANSAQVPRHRAYIFAPERFDAVLLVFIIGFAQLGSYESAALACSIYIASLRERIRTNPTSEPLKLNLAFALAALALILLNTSRTPMAITSKDSLFSTVVLGRTIEAIHAIEEAFALFRDLRALAEQGEIITEDDFVVCTLRLVYSKALYEHTFGTNDETAHDVFLLRKSRSILEPVIRKLVPACFHITVGQVPSEEMKYVAACALQLQFTANQSLERSMFFLEEDLPAYVRELKAQANATAAEGASKDDKNSSRSAGEEQNSDMDEDDSEQDEPDYWAEDENLRQYTRRVLSAAYATRSVGSSGKPAQSAPAPLFAAGVLQSRASVAVGSASAAVLAAGPAHPAAPSPSYAPPATQTPTATTAATESVSPVKYMPSSVLRRLSYSRSHLYEPLLAAELLEEGSRGGPSAIFLLRESARLFEKISVVFPTQYLDNLARVWQHITERLLDARLLTQDIINATRKATTIELQLSGSPVPRFWRGYNAAAAFLTTAALFLAHAERYQEGCNAAASAHDLLKQNSRFEDKSFTADPISLAAFNMWLLGNHPIASAIQGLSRAASLRPEWKGIAKGFIDFHAPTHALNGVLTSVWLAGAQSCAGQMKDALQNGRGAVEKLRMLMRKPPFPKWGKDALMPPSCALPHVLVIWAGVLLAAGPGHHEEARTTVEEALALIWEQTASPPLTGSTGGLAAAGDEKKSSPYEESPRTDGSTTKTALLIKVALLEHQIKAVMEEEDLPQVEIKRQRKKVKREGNQRSLETEAHAAAAAAAAVPASIPSGAVSFGIGDSSDSDISSGASGGAAERKRKRKSSQRRLDGQGDSKEPSEALDWTSESDEDKMQAKGRRNEKRLPEKDRSPSQRQLSLRSQLEAYKRMADRLPERGFLHRLLPDEGGGAGLAKEAAAATPTHAQDGSAAVAMAAAGQSDPVAVPPASSEAAA